MDRELLFTVTKKDLEISFFSGSGSGGQHRNKHKNCVRMRHPDSGAMSTGQDCKSKERNIKAAYMRLTKTPKFTNWLQIRIAEESTAHKLIAEKVERDMCEENIKIEYGPF